jgi:ribosomal protein S18 acetylase RimI-like enzyme
LLAGDAHGLAGSVYVRAEPPRGYFGMLAVHPGHQGSGLGRALIEAAEEHCREAGCDLMDLSVVNLREELFPWYERLGYAVSGEVPWPENDLHELSRPAHFITMSKPLARAAVGGLAHG